MPATAATGRRRLGTIHTVTSLVPVFDDLIGRLMPEWAPFNIVDESLLRNTIRSGELSHMTMRRLAGHVWSAVDAGAEAVLVTCSSIGAAVDAVVPLCPVPLVRVDVGMVDRALEIGKRIGVLATLPTTLKPTSELVRVRAALAGKPVDILPQLCVGAFDKLSTGDRAAHDGLVVEGALALVDKVDVIVLAQASMAKAFEGEVSGRIAVPVLSSPELGVLNLKRQLS